MRKKIFFLFIRGYAAASRQNKKKFFFNPTAEKEKECSRRTLVKKNDCEFRVTACHRYHLHFSRLTFINNDIPTRTHAHTYKSTHAKDVSEFQNGGDENTNKIHRNFFPDFYITTRSFALVFALVYEKSRDRNSLIRKPKWRKCRFNGR